MMLGHRTRSPTPTRTAQVMAAATIALVVAALLLAPTNDRQPLLQLLITRAGNALFASICAAVGLLIVIRRPRNPIGWDLPGQPVVRSWGVRRRLHHQGPGQHAPTARRGLGRLDRRSHLERHGTDRGDFAAVVVPDWSATLAPLASDHLGGGHSHRGRHSGLGDASSRAPEVLPDCPEPDWDGGGLLAP